MEKFRHVARPIRGFGKCPNAESHHRYAKSGCNEQRCKGDEMCVATQDLVIAIDGSGSIREGGFKILKKFVEKLLTRYRTEFWGADAVKIGIVLFGNGVIMPDGKSVSPAILASPLSFDMAAIQTVVSELPFKKGFTNMAQAFSSAETAFLQGSRRGAQSSVMVVTDGKPSFNFMTTEMVEQLEDKGVTRFFLLVNEEDLSSNANKLMKSWASDPWETNVVHVPGGLALLDSDMDLWADKALVKFCPRAYSPSEAVYIEINHGFALIKMGGFCGSKLDENMLTDSATSTEDCAALAQGAGATAFILGIGFAKGKCFRSDLQVDQTLWDKWEGERINPECTEGEGWESTTLFDFYAIKPMEEAPVEK